MNEVSRNIHGLYHFSFYQREYLKSQYMFTVRNITRENSYINFTGRNIPKVYVLQEISQAGICALSMSIDLNFTGRVFYIFVKMYINLTGQEYFEGQHFYTVS